MQRLFLFFEGIPEEVLARDFDFMGDSPETLGHGCLKGPEVDSGAFVSGSVIERKLFGPYFLMREKD
jgi:hypothetical protein